MERAAIPEVRKAAEDSFASGLYCAESVVMAIADAEGVESELLPRVATGFGGGMARTGGACGALTGAIMGVGLALGRSSGDRIGRTRVRSDPARDRGFRTRVRRA